MIMKVHGVVGVFFGSGVSLWVKVRGMGTVLNVQNLHKWD